MFFNMTTKLYCEPHCIDNHKDELAALGKKAYIITGRNSSKKNGSLRDITSALDYIGAKYIIYDKMEENPSVEIIIKATEYGKDFMPDYVIGIGGGSPLDASKAIALMLANGHRGQDLLFDAASEYNDALPVVAVPTTCGTGSEVTPYSILTLHDKKTKSSLPHRIFPETALADPEYLSYAPDSLLINTAVDALGHFIESHINARSTLISRTMSEKGLSMWQTVKGILLKKDRNYSDYETLLMVSSIAGMAISHTGTSLPHGMSYSLTYDYGIPHGKAVGTFLAPYIDNSDDADKSAVLNLLGYKTSAGLYDDLMKLIGDVKIPKDKYISYIDAMKLNERKLSSCPFKATGKTVEAIYAESLIKTF